MIQQIGHLGVPSEPRPAKPVNKGKDFETSVEVFWDSPGEEEGLMA